jgi:hypothetical protein
MFVYRGGRNSSVGIAARYGLDGPVIESLWGTRFSAPVQTPWGPPSLLYNGYRFSFPVVKRTGRSVDHPPPSSAEVKERVELYLNSTSGLSWPVLGLTWPLPFLYTEVQIFFFFKNLGAISKLRRHNGDMQQALYLGPTKFSCLGDPAPGICAVLYMLYIYMYVYINIHTPSYMYTSWKWS